MTFYTKRKDGSIRLSAAIDPTSEDLPVGTYMVQKDLFGFYLEAVSPFTRPKKLYGTVDTRAGRIIDTFNDRTASTGVLLSGEMGSGKTMMARELSLRLMDVGVSTIIVTDKEHHGPDFNAFIQLIDVPALILFDEFEKVYDDEGQEEMLSLLDGVFPTKKLFVLTCNSVWKINEHMINRPGRIYYHLKYKGLEKAFIVEYCEDNLINKAHIEGVERISDYFYAFNFDMLKALVEEMNRYSISAGDAVEMLNVSPSTKDNVYHDVVVLYKGQPLKHFGKDEQLHCSPLSGENMSIHYYGDRSHDYDYDADGKKKKKEKIDLPEPGDFNFSTDDLVSAENGVYTFELKAQHLTIILTRVKDKEFHYAF